MKMTKENMENIRDRFESKTGTVLPEKKLHISPGLSCLMLTAAGLVCVVGMAAFWLNLNERRSTSDSTEDITAENTYILYEDSTKELEAYETADEPNVSEESVTYMAEEKSPDVKIAVMKGDKQADELIAELPAEDINTDGELLTPGELREQGYWYWPVVGGEISAGFSEKHPAVDIAAEEGAYVGAVRDGTIKETGFNADDGNYVRQILDSGEEAFYAHLKSIDVEEGSYVQMGMPIGTLGKSGMATGPHLHLELKNPQGEALDFTLLDPYTVG